MRKYIITITLVLFFGFIVGYFSRTQATLRDVTTKEVSESRNEAAEKAFRNLIGKLPPFTTACFPISKYMCGGGKCDSVELGTSFTLLDKRRAISRCDAKGCDTYDAQYAQSGAYEIYEPKTPRGFFLKKELIPLVEEDSISYVEVATVGVGSLLYNGYCRDVS